MKSIIRTHYKPGASPVGQQIKNPPANAGNVRDMGSIPGSARSSGEGHGKSLQYSCLEHPKDRGSWWAMVHRVAKSQTQLKQLSTHYESGILIHSFVP